MSSFCQKNKFQIMFKITAIIFLLSLSRFVDAHQNNTVPGCYIISFKQRNEGSRNSTSAALVSSARDKVKSNVMNIGKISREFNGAINGLTVCGIKSESLLKSIRDHPEVALVEQDQVIQALDMKAVANPLSWGLDRIDQRINTLDRRFYYDDRSAPVDVYILDTGIYTQHVQFQGRAISGYNFVNNNGDTSDCHGHGTHCAGTVGSLDYGVCKHCRLIAVKVLGCDGFGSTSGIVSAINWVVNRAASTKVPSVISMSLGGSYTKQLNSAVEAAVQAGVVTVVAAGNDNDNACQYSPASAPSAITVGAVSQTNAKSSYSNFGSCVDIFAPGNDIRSTWVGSTTATVALSGTSFAAPHVAGFAAVYYSYNPTKTAGEVRNYIVDRATRDVISGISGSTPNRLLYTRLEGGLIGNVDGFVPTDTGANLIGWACNTGLSRSIDVYVYAGWAAGQGVNFLKARPANAAIENGVSSACDTSGVAHRFVIPFSFQEISSFNANKLFVYGISADSRYPNTLLSNSGIFPSDLSIRGSVDGLTPTATGVNLNGWACNFGISKSISVHIYGGGGAAGQGGVFLKAGTANLFSEKAVSSACGTLSAAYRFSIPLTFDDLNSLNGKKFFVHGISAVSGYANALLQNSGKFPDFGIKGSVDNFVSTLTGGNLNGWACNFGISTSVSVHIHSGGAAGQGGVFLKAGTANLLTERAVSTACGTSSVAYRFSIPLTFDDLNSLNGKKLFVHGISAVSGYANALLQNSGKFPDFGIKGSVDNFVSTLTGGNLNGWACNFGISTSVSVHIYSGGAAGQGGVFLKAGTANLTTEAAISNACGTWNTAHRFSVPISNSELNSLNGKKIFVYGISAVNGYANALLGNGGGLFPLEFTSKPVIIGQVVFGNTQLGYALKAQFQSYNISFPVVHNGAQASALYPEGGGWGGLGVAIFGSSSYKMYWKKTNPLEFSEWTLNAKGEYLSSKSLLYSEFLAAESSLKFDLDGNGFVGL
jgi:subtilisin family serine protease